MVVVVLLVSSAGAWFKEERGMFSSAAGWMFAVGVGREGVSGKNRRRRQRSSDRGEFFSVCNGSTVSSSGRRAGGKAEEVEDPRVVGSVLLVDGPRVSSSSSLEQAPRVPSGELVSSFEVELEDDDASRLRRVRGRGGGVVESSEEVELGSGVQRPGLRCVLAGVWFARRK